MASSIHDLARHLNISIGTVSRALNGRADVNAETRQRVLDAARKLNYSPNQSGRNLRRGATQSVAFMLQPHPGDQQYGEPFFIPFLTGLQAKLAEYGLDLMVVMGAPGDYQQERLRRVVETRRADAVVLAATRREDDRIDYLDPGGLPVRHAGAQPVGWPLVPLARPRLREGGVRCGGSPRLARPHADRSRPPLAQSEFRLSLHGGLPQGTEAAWHRFRSRIDGSRSHQRVRRLRGDAGPHARQKTADGDHLQQ